MQMELELRGNQGKKGRRRTLRKQRERVEARLEELRKCATGSMTDEVTLGTYRRSSDVVVETRGATQALENAAFCSSLLSSPSSSLSALSSSNLMREEPHPPGTTRLGDALEADMASQALKPDSSVVQKIEEITALPIGCAECNVGGGAGGGGAIETSTSGNVDYDVNMLFKNPKIRGGWGFWKS